MRSFKILLTGAIFFLCGNIYAQTQSAQPDMQMMMKNIMPGDHQKKMAERSGNWTAKITMWMDPSQPPTVSEAKAKYEMIMDRYLTSTYTGTMMGMPFTGMSTMAYDNGTGIYYMTWIDNMSTGMMQMTGKYDEKTKTIEFKGIGQDPSTGKEVPMRQTIRFVDDKTEHMEMFAPDMDGKETKMMEIDLMKG